MPKKSKKYKLNSEDTKKILKNALIFFAPALLMFLVELQAGKPVNEALSVIYLWFLNTSIDLLRKFIAGR